MAKKLCGSYAIRLDEPLIFRLRIMSFLLSLKIVLFGQALRCTKQDIIERQKKDIFQRKKKNMVQ